MIGRLDGKTAWVTGAGRGIGRSIALAMAGAGASLGLSSRTVEELDAVADEIALAGGKAFAVTADALSLDSTLAAASAIADSLGTIDILVNNAGGGVSPRRDPELSPAALDDFAFMDNVDLNLFSAYRASQAVLPAMLEQGDGRIINIGSGYAKRSGGGLAYSAAKHGLIGLTRAMAANVATRGVTINCLCPGWTNTQLVDLDLMADMAKTDVATIKARIEAENLQKRILEPDELGPMAVLLAAPESYGVTGQVISVDGGYGV